MQTKNKWPVILTLSEVKGKNPHIRLATEDPHSRLLPHNYQRAPS
jgi:hypothetical protein